MALSNKKGPEQLQLLQALNLPGTLDSSIGRPGLTRLGSGMLSPSGRRCQENPQILWIGGSHGGRKAGTSGIPLGMLQVLQALADGQARLPPERRVLYVPSAV